MFLASDPLPYNSCMENNHWSRDQLLAKYETGVWIFLIIAAAAFFGFILWLGYMVFL